MSNQTLIQPVLDEPAWASGVIESNQSAVALRLQTFPGVIGGEFKAQIVGLMPEHSGLAQVTISCNASDSDNRFLEVESFKIETSSVQVHFLIPFEASGTEEGGQWQLRIQFAYGSTEVFEIPVCRTFESNPEVSNLEIAAAGLSKKEQWQAQRSEERSGRSWRKSFELTKEGGRLLVSIPSRVPGRPSFAKGLGVFWGLWAAATVLFYFITQGDIEAMIILGVPLAAMTTILAFVMFGKSKIKFSGDQMEQRHSLFGLSIPKKIKRSAIAGFDMKCFGSLGEAGESYLVVVEKSDSSSVFLSAALFNKSDAHTLIKRLNEFWEFKRNY